MMVFLSTGTVSFLLYGIFIFIAIMAVIIVYIFLKKEILEERKLDKLINFFKTVILTIALGTVALIITDLFEERKQVIVELEYFDKYIEDVKKVNGEGRLQLSKYLSIVAPSGEMKNSWTNYYNEVKREYDEYKVAQQENKNDTIVNPTTEQLFRRKENLSKIALFESPLTMDNTANEYYIVASSDKSINEAKVELDKAIEINTNSTIIKKGNYYATVLQGYLTIQEAKKQLHEVQSKINKTAFIVDKQKWCDYFEITDECLICK
jgi:hypothetical protein